MARPTRRRAIGVVVVVLGVVTVLAALGGTAVLRTRRFVTGNPDFCRECHADASQHLRSKVHGELACSTCHRADFGAGVRRWLTVKLRGAGGAVPHGQVLTERCKECHSGEEHDRRLFAELGGHTTHVLEADLACTECHGAATHVESVKQDACRACHEDVELFPSPTDGASCTSCHAFVARSRTAPSLTDPVCTRCHHRPTTAVAYEATHEASVTPAMVHGEIGACGLCHLPHGEAPSERVGGLDCARCHANIARKRATAPDYAAHADCSTCHAPHGERAELVDLCAGCHTERSPTATPAATSAKHETCADCHRDHRFTVEASRCGECHTEEAKKATVFEPDAHHDCLHCHAPHSETPVFDACKNCHGAHQRHGHEDCATCHTPHAERKGSSNCSGCHTPVLTAVQASSAVQQGAHRTCTDCHAPHAAGTAATSCARCHRPEAELAERAPAVKHQRCASCHQPHAFSASTAICSTCHRAGDLGDHQQDCGSCHQAHGTSAPPTVDCRGCHQGINQSRGEHAACTSCHDVHQSDRGGPGCAACHRAYSSGVATWAQPEHRDCLSCHEKHDAATPRNCASCHPAQTASLGGSKHRCSSCHDPHEPTHDGWSGCAGCHPTHAASSAGRSPQHAQCKSCHSPHAAGSTTTCRSCHTVAPGLHVHAEHRQCASCHATHSSRLPDRDACLKCHDDMPDHFPAARTCTACHSFR